MRTTAEFLLFGLLALGLHVILMPNWSNTGTQAQGAGGESLITLAAATAQIETMVDDWTRPPQVQHQSAANQPKSDIAPQQAPAASLRIDEAPNAILKLAAIPKQDQDAPQHPEVPQFAPLRPPEQAQDPTLTPPPQLAQPTPQPSIEPDQPQDLTRASPLAMPNVQLDTPPEPLLAPPPPPSPLAEAKVVPKTKPKPRPTQSPKQVANPKPKAKPAAKKQTPSTSQSAQKATGSGGSTQAGTDGQTNTSTLSKGQESSLIATWGARVRSQVERRKRYPSGTTASGQVSLRLTIGRNGKLQGVSVRQSSGDAKLDAAAVTAVQRAGRFPKAPKQLTKPTYTFSLSIGFVR